MTQHSIASSASSTADQAPGLLAGSLDIHAATPGEYELTIDVQQLGAGVLRLAIVNTVTAGETTYYLPVCMINVEGPIGGAPGTETTEAPATQYSQSWTQSDIPGVPFGADSALLQVYCYQSDSAAVVSATAIY
jgi:hypothetical protein